MVITTGDADRTVERFEAAGLALRRERRTTAGGNPMRQCFLWAGDVILEVAGKNVAKPGDVADALEAARSDKKSSVLMRLRSGDASRYVALPLANS